MKTYQFEIVKKYFPFLGEFVVSRQPDYVKVEKAGTEILDRVGWSNRYSSSLADFFEHEFYFVFDGNGMCEVPSRGNYAEGSGCRVEWGGVSVGEFCFEGDLRPQIVVGLKRTEADSCGNATEKIEMTIYQLEGINWEEYYQTKIQQAEQALGF